MRFARLTNARRLPTNATFPPPMTANARILLAPETPAHTQRFTAFRTRTHAFPTHARQFHTPRILPTANTLIFHAGFTEFRTRTVAPHTNEASYIFILVRDAFARRFLTRFT